MYRIGTDILAELERLAFAGIMEIPKAEPGNQKIQRHPFLERYIHTIFRKQVIDFNSESDPRKADSNFFIWKTNASASILDYTHLSTRGFMVILKETIFRILLRDWYF